MTSYLAGWPGYIFETSMPLPGRLCECMPQHSCHAAQDICGVLEKQAAQPQAQVEQPEAPEAANAPQQPPPQPQQPPPQPHQLPRPSVPVAGKQKSRRPLSTDAGHAAARGQWGCKYLSVQTDLQQDSLLLARSCLG